MLMIDRETEAAPLTSSSPDGPLELSTTTSDDEEKKAPVESLVAPVGAVPVEEEDEAPPVGMAVPVDDDDMVAPVDDDEAVAPVDNELDAPVDDDDRAVPADDEAAEPVDEDEPADASEPVDEDAELDDTAPVDDDDDEPGTSEAVYIALTCCWLTACEYIANESSAPLNLASLLHDEPPMRASTRDAYNGYDLMSVSSTSSPL